MNTEMFLQRLRVRSQLICRVVRARAAPSVMSDSIGHDRMSVPSLIPTFVIVIAGLMGTACGGGESEHLGNWVVERDTIGDTVVVRTLSGSLWGQSATLVEELVIGVLEGEDELMFGQVQAMAPDYHGGVYVFDGQVPALRYYDGNGTYVRTLGGEGSGPGEYGDVALGLAVRSDGRLVMRDPRNGRLNGYDVDGTPWAHWQVASHLYTDRAMVLDTNDHVLLKVLLERPQRNRPWRIGLLHLNSDGLIVDTIADPRIAEEPGTAAGVFLPQKVWAWSPFGYPVVGITDIYRFEIRRPHEPDVHVERDFESVSLLSGERAAHEARNEWRRQRRDHFIISEIPAVPAKKPAYRAIYVGERGRVWVHRHVVAKPVDVDTDPRPDLPPPVGWLEPTVFDVFEPDGAYLGEVFVPDRTSIQVFSGDTLWGIRRGDLDEQYVVRLLLSHSDH
jgi:hypothetical protein